MLLPVIRTSVRGQDVWGSGEFEASRSGGRKHKGIDIVAPPGAEVIAVSGGHVSKIWYPYSQADPESFPNEDERRRFYEKKALRYVEIETFLGRRVRYFYINPVVEVGDHVAAGRTTLGIVKNLQGIYPGITDHYHFEVKDKSGLIMNPYQYLGDLM